MTDQEINIAIAEACGWEREVVHDELCNEDFQAWKRDGRRLLTPMGLPDYCHDLNAMHEAESVLSVSERSTFMDKLDDSVPLLDVDQNVNYSEWHLCHSTARQRAEAFLRVKGLWREEGIAKSKPRA